MMILHVSDVHCARGMITRAFETGSYDLVVATGDLECTRRRSWSPSPPACSR